MYFDPENTIGREKNANQSISYTHKRRQTNQLRQKLSTNYQTKDMRNHVQIITKFTYIFNKFAHEKNENLYIY